MMDLISGIIFVILFIIIMIFAFSMGILSPYVGRKEIVSIIVIGFVLGTIGGYFFIYPIYQENPYVVGNIQGLFTMEDEVINLNIPSTSNLSDISSKILNLEGVNSVSTNGFELKTSTINQNQHDDIESYLKNDSAVETYKVESNSISVNLKNDESSTQTLGSLVSYLSNNEQISSEFAFVHIKVKVNANSVLDVREYLRDNGYTILSIEGPVQDTIKFLTNHMLPFYVIMVITGFIGVIVSIAGIYVDSLTKFFRRFRKSKTNRP